MRKIRKGFSGVDTPLFDGMLVPQQAQDVEDAAEDENDDHETTDISMTLLNTLLETCATLTKQVANLEQDKIDQAIEITKLKQRVKRLEKKSKFKSSGLKRSRKVKTAQRVKSSADTVMDDQEDASKQEGGRWLAETQAKVYHLDLQHSKKVYSMQDTDEAEPAKVEEVIKVVTAAELMTEVVTTTATTITAAQVPKASASTRKRGVIIQDHEEAATASVIVHTEDKFKDKGKGILIEEPKPLKRQTQIEQD
nr:hypothetical protein [Tanacetum cinerariifolium]